MYYYYNNIQNIAWGQHHVIYLLKELLKHTIIEVQKKTIMEHAEGYGSEQLLR